MTARTALPQLLLASHGATTVVVTHACGALARFASPHDLELTADGAALLVTDTQNDVVRVVSLAPGAGYGCARTLPLKR